MEINKVVEQLKKQIALQLPGIEAHRQMLPSGRKLDANYRELAVNYKQSAVLALLYPNQNSLHLLLTKRQEYVGAHSGQISFPGGKKEVHDSNLLETALRETKEETGISSNKIELIGALTPVYIPVSNFMVQPYLAFVNELPQLILNTREVRETIHVPIQLLMQEETRIQTKIIASSSMTLDVPAFYFDPHIIWGATAMMISEINELFKVAEL